MNRNPACPGPRRRRCFVQRHVPNRFRGEPDRHDGRTDFCGWCVLCTWELLPLLLPMLPRDRSIPGGSQAGKGRESRDVPVEVGMWSRFPAHCSICNRFGLPSLRQQLARATTVRKDRPGSRAPACGRRQRVLAGFPRDRVPSRRRARGARRRAAFAAPPERVRPSHRSSLRPARRRTHSRFPRRAGCVPRAPCPGSRRANRRASGGDPPSLPRSDRER